MNRRIKDIIQELNQIETKKYSADGLEYLWQGDAEYWSGQAPILFPICGSIRDNKAVIGNQKTTSIQERKHFHSS